MRQLLFSIDRMEFLGGGKAVVAGRCCGDLMKSGDLAQLMVRVSTDERGETIILESEPISVTMPDFLVYNHKLDTMHPGDTGGLILSIDVATGLRFGWYLKGENA